MTPRSIPPSHRDPEAWQPGVVTRWILAEGRFLLEPEAFFKGLCAALRNHGVPVARMACGMPTLNPQSQAVTWEWNIGDNIPRPVLRPHGIELRPEFTASPIARVADSEPFVRRRLTGPQAVIDFPVLHELRAAGLTDYLVLPLSSADRGRYCVTWATDSAAGFSEAAIAVLFDIEPALALILELQAQRFTARSLLATYLGADAGHRVLDGRILRGDSELIQAVIWYCDLRDFTAMSERFPGTGLIATLNDYFACVGEPVEATGGEILKFIGDAVLGIFRIEGCFARVEAACAAALQAATEAFQRLLVLNEQRRMAGVPELRMGAALHVGDVYYGNVGTPNRLDFTVIGPAVNLVARLADLCKVAGEPLLFSECFAQALRRDVRDIGVHNIRGLRTGQRVYAPEVAPLCCPHVDRPSIESGEFNVLNHSATSDAGH